MTDLDRPEWVSVRAVAWVLDDAPVPVELLPALVAVARRCGDDGKGSRQATATIAEKIGKSKKQAQRDLVKLRELGLLVLGDQALVGHLPPGQRPTVYDVPLHIKGTKPIKEAKNPTGLKKTGTPPMEGTPPLQGSTPMEGTGRGPMEGESTPPMDGSQKKPLNNPNEKPSSPYPLVVADSAAVGEVVEGEVIEEEDFQKPEDQRAALVAEIRQIRPEWSKPSIEKAINDALAADRTFDETVDAFPRCASDPTTQHPGRLAHNGLWWSPPLPDGPDRSKPEKCGECDPNRFISVEEDGHTRAAYCPNCHPKGVNGGKRRPDWSEVDRAGQRPVGRHGYHRVRNTHAKPYTTLSEALAQQEAENERNAR